jgi:hypothetical protein
MSDFSSKIHSSINTPVIMYSVSEKRAWMVSLVSVLLHLTRVRAHYQKVLGFNIPACAPASNGGEAAFSHIMSCYRQPLKVAASNEYLDPSEQQMTIKDYINDVWATLDCAQRESSKARRLFRTHIIGYEAADIARLKPTLRMKKQSLDLFATGWTPLLDEVKLSLFYEGLFDPIIATGHGQPANTCSAGLWRAIPPGFNLLTVSLPCLIGLSEHLNGLRFTGRLTTRYSWHNRGHSRTLFSTCSRPYSHVCNRLQEVVPDKSNGYSSPDPEVLAGNPSGAVVFRYEENMETILAFLDSAALNSSGIVTPTRDSGYGSQESRSPRPDELNSFALLSIQDDPPHRPVDSDAAQALDEVPELPQVTNPGTRMQSNIEMSPRLFSTAAAAAPQIPVQRTPRRHEPEHSQRSSHPSAMRPAPLIGTPRTPQQREAGSSQSPGSPEETRTAPTSSGGSRQISRTHAARQSTRRAQKRRQLIRPVAQNPLLCPTQ